jgi:1-acyl-sn-glycerol-3-phosphate acyltransferase
MKSLSIAVPPSIPRRGGAVSRAIGRTGLALLGWKLEGRVPDALKLVVVVAPHTSNWDFIIGLFVKFALELDASYLAKQQLFRRPFGALFRYWGGIPVIRSATSDMVDQIIEQFRKRRQLFLVITPEGTRKPVPRWRSGFYHIAREAHVPILLVTLDWTRKVVHFGPTVRPNGPSGRMPFAQAAREIEQIRSHYRGVRGKNGSR